YGGPASPDSQAGLVAAPPRRWQPAGSGPRRPRRLQSKVIAWPSSRGVIIRLMAVLSRRDFGSVLVAGLPLATVLGSVRVSAAAVAIGVSTSSFRDLPRVPG